MCVGNFKLSHITCKCFFFMFTDLVVLEEVLQNVWASTNSTSSRFNDKWSAVDHVSIL